MSRVWNAELGLCPVDNGLQLLADTKQGVRCKVASFLPWSAKGLFWFLSSTSQNVEKNTAPEKLRSQHIIYSYNQFSVSFSSILLVTRDMLQTPSMHCSLNCFIQHVDPSASPRSVELQTSAFVGYPNGSTSPRQTVQQKSVRKSENRPN